MRQRSTALYKAREYRISFGPLSECFRCFGNTTRNNIKHSFNVCTSYYQSNIHLLSVRPYETERALRVNISTSQNNSSVTFQISCIFNVLIKYRYPDMHLYPH